MTLELPALPTQQQMMVFESRKGDCALLARCSQLREFLETAARLEPLKRWTGPQPPAASATLGTIGLSSPWITYVAIGVAAMLLFRSTRRK